MAATTYFDGLRETYWREQGERVERLRQKISDGDLASAAGRVIPAADDLAIGAGRRLPMTVLFTDISGFSGRDSWTAEQQEMNLRVLNLYFTEMIKIVEDHGGTVEKNTGDGLMAYFEDSSEYEDADNSTKRAVACTLTMFAANAYLITPILIASNVAPIKFRASIEHGTITIARIGAARGFSANAAIGNAANFASKMLSKIQADDLCLGWAAHQRLPTSWQTPWTQLADISTGWSFTLGGAPYPLYRFTGRWARVV